MSTVSQYRKRFEQITDAINPPEVAVILAIMVFAVITLLANGVYRAALWLWEASCLGC